MAPRDDRVWSKSKSADERAEAFNYYKASLYAIGRHEVALNAICSESRAASVAAERWVFDIHAHARSIALNETKARPAKAWPDMPVGNPR